MPATPAAHAGAPSADCPSTGLLRTHLDHPATAVEAHLDDCPACRDVIVGLAADAGAARRLIGLLDADADQGLEAGHGTDAAPAGRGGFGPSALAAADDMGERRSRPRLRGRTGPRGVAPADRRRRPAGPGTSRQRGDRASRRLVPVLGLALVLAAALTLTPGGTAAVAQFLDTFRGERLQVVQVDTSALGDLEGLAALGDVDLADAADPVITDDPAEAAGVAGLTPPDATALAAALDVDDAGATYLATDGTTATLTLRARDGNGVPAALDGAALHVTVPPAVVTLLGDELPAAGDLDSLPDVVAGTAGTVEIAAEGASLADIRAFLLDRDELPDQLRDQLAGIRDWRHTLPIPVPAAGMAWDDITVAGAPGVAFGDDSGLGAAVIWQADGQLHGLAGPHPRQVLVELASG